MTDPTMKTRASDPPIKISREIPLPWLIGLVCGLVFQAIVMWTGQQAQGQAIKEMTAELKELRAAVQAGDIKSVEHRIRLDDHERRMQALEARPRKE